MKNLKSQIGINWLDLKIKHNIQCAFLVTNVQPSRFNCFLAHLKKAMQQMNAPYLGLKVSQLYSYLAFPFIHFSFLSNF